MERAEDGVGNERASTNPIGAMGIGIAARATIHFTHALRLAFEHMDDLESVGVERRRTRASEPVRRRVAVPPAGPEPRLC
jgi:hypothetical protein